MNPNEIFEYVTEGLKWIAIGGGSYFVALFGHSLVFQSSLFHEKIRSQEELDTIVREEAEKLGLDPSKIDAKYNGETIAAKKNEERYDLSIEGMLSTRPTVRHELYHIKSGDCDKFPDDVPVNLIYYFFVMEPRAKFYATTGIKL